MPTAFFLGAGASAQDGLPVTANLNYSIAAFLCSARGRHSSLYRYYRELYGVTKPQIASAAAVWKAFLLDRDLFSDPDKRPKKPNPLPSLVETLSILDLALQEASSFGVANTPRRRREFELDQPTLMTARMELSMALGRAIDEAMHGHSTPLAHEFVRCLRGGDTVISTNWDTLMERALTAIQREKEDGGRHLQATNIRYCAVNERLVNYHGNDIPRRARNSTTVLKLHGSLNWFFCPSCGELYANVEGIWVIDPLARRLKYDECHCGAWLENLTIAPSFVKTYDNVHVRSTWQHARRVLEEADRWVFIGYRLPPDDYHIRALLLRSLRTHHARQGKGALRIVVASRTTAGEIETHYRDLFRLVKPTFIDGGLEGYLADPASSRSNL